LGIEEPKMGDAADEKKEPKVIKEEITVK